jgi:hypothetical protein
MEPSLERGREEPVRWRLLSHPGLIRGGHHRRPKSERGERERADLPQVLLPPLRQARSNVGTLDVSMQDEIGFVRLMHRKYPKLQVVIRSQRPHQLRTSMYSAALVKLPATGTVAVSGTRYQVRSFQEKDWGGEPVTISLLMKG